MGRDDRQGALFCLLRERVEITIREEEEEVERLHVWIGEGALEESGSRHG